MSKKRVVFVQPGFERGWGTDFTYREQLPHIGLAYVAAAARAAGHMVAVVDGRADGASVDEVARRTADFDPDVVAITANSTQVDAAGQIASRLRATFPDRLLVLGGYHVSPIPVETLEEFPQFDAAVFGEGEQTIVELLAAADGRDVPDETFTLNKKRALAFCEGMLRRGLHRRIQWACETRVDAVDRDLVALMRRAGCYSIFFGIESGNQTVLDGIKKKIDKEEALRAIRWSREAGIFSHTGFIFGHPNETRETIRDTIDFALSVDSDACSFSIMIPFPGTPVLEMARAGVGGLRLLSNDWRTYAGQVGAALELEDVPRAALQRLQFSAYARFYARPRKWINFMKTGRVTAIPIVLGHMAASQARAFWTPRPPRRPMPAPTKTPASVPLRASRGAPPIA